LFSSQNCPEYGCDYAEECHHSGILAHPEKLNDFNPNGIFAEHGGLRTGRIYLQRVGRNRRLPDLCQSLLRPGANLRRTLRATRVHRLQLLRHHGVYGHLRRHAGRVRMLTVRERVRERPTALLLIACSLSLRPPPGAEVTSCSTPPALRYHSVFASLSRSSYTRSFSLPWLLYPLLYPCTPISSIRGLWMKMGIRFSLSSLSR